jgi:hypothetical protein
MSNKFKIGTRVQGVSFMEDGTYDQLGEGNIFKIHKIYSNMYSYTIKCNRPNKHDFFMVFYEDELEEIDDE